MECVADSAAVHGAVPRATVSEHSAQTLLKRGKYFPVWCKKNPNPAEETDHTSADVCIYKRKKKKTTNQELNGDEEEFFICFFLSFYQEPSESHSTSVTFPAACSTVPVGSVHYLYTLQSWPQGWASGTAFLHALLLFKRNICIILPFPSREVRLATGRG